MSSPSPLGSPSSLRGRLRAGYQEIASLLADLNTEAAVILTSAALLIVLYRSNGTIGAYYRFFGRGPSGLEWSPLLPYLYWFASSGLALLLVPLIVGARLLRLDRRALGLCLGDWRTGLRVSLGLYFLMLPVVLVAASTPAFAQHYPLSRFVASQALQSLRGEAALGWVVLVYELGYGLYFVGWELFFRGYLTLGLSRSMGATAIFVQMVPFAVLHLGKPQAEALGSVVAGLALGLLALRTRSMLWGLLLHVAIAWTMDLLALFVRI